MPTLNTTCGAVAGRQAGELVAGDLVGAEPDGAELETSPSAAASRADASAGWDIRGSAASLSSRNRQTTSATKITATHLSSAMRRSSRCSRKDLRGPPSAGSGGITSQGSAMVGGDQSMAIQDWRAFATRLAAMSHGMPSSEAPGRNLFAPGPHAAQRARGFFGEKARVGLLDALAQADLRLPAEGGELRDIQQLARRAVGLGGVPDDAALEADDRGDERGRAPGWSHRCRCRR